MIITGYWLVVDYPSEKYEFVSWDDYSLYIYIYTRNAWVLPRRCSVYIYNSQTNDIANYSNSYGKNNKGIRDY